MADLTTGENTGAPPAVAAADPARITTPAGVKAAADDAQATAPAAAAPVAPAEGDAALPAEVAAVPAAKPGTPVAQAVEIPAAAAAAPPAEEKPAQVAMAVPDPVDKPETDKGAEPAVTVKPTAFIENGPGPAVPQAKKRGFLAGLFANQATSEESPRPIVRKAAVRSPVEAGSTPAMAKAEAARPAEADEQAAAKSEPQVAVKAAAPLIAKEKADKPLVMLASTGPTSGFANDALPGVRRQTALFEITRKSGIDDDSDIDLHEDEEFVQVASAAGMARLAPNGLLKQTEAVDVGCLKPSLVRVLKTVEQYYGKKMVVTSGFRSPERNRKARGARNSLHMYCAAADVQVPGVSKWELAKFVRSMPGRGGVGTYCHTESVHIDVGPERDWNWRCRRKKA